MELLTVRGVTIRAHYLFCLLMIVLGICGQLAEAGIIFACVIFHELCHSMAAVWLGYRVTKIELLPFGGVAEIDELKGDGWQEAVIILAGPVGSALCAGACYWNAAGAEGAVRLVMETNFMLALWNLLPAYPLDGGRLMRILFGYLMTQKEAVGRTVRISYVVAAVLLFYTVYSWSISGEILVSMMILAGMIIRLSRAEEEKSGLLPFYTMAGKHRAFLVKGYAVTRWYTVRSDMRVRAVVELFRPNTYTMIRVVTRAGKECGILSESAIWQGLAYHQPNESIENFCEREE